MSRKTILFILLAFLFSGAQAQLFFLPAKDVEKLKGRKLVIVLPEEQAFFLNKYRKKPEKLQQYKEMVAGTRKVLESVFPEYWTVSSEILYKKESEVASLAPLSEYIVMRYHFNEKVFGFPPGLDTFELRRQSFRDAIYGKMEFSFLEKQKTGAFLLWYVPTSYPFRTDFIASVSQLNYFLVIKQVKPAFNMKEYEEIIEDRNVRLVDKTLLIDSAQVEKQFGSYKFVKDDYPYPFRLTSIDEINKAIEARDSTKAYVTVLPHHDVVNRGGTFEGTSGGGMEKFSGQLYFTHLVVDCASFEIIGIGKNIEPVINRRALKHYVKAIDKDSPSDTINNPENNNR